MGESCGAAEVEAQNDVEVCNIEGSTPNASAVCQCCTLQGRQGSATALQALNMPADKGPSSAELATCGIQLTFSAATAHTTEASISAAIVRGLNSNLVFGVTSSLNSSGKVLPDFRGLNPIGEHQRHLEGILQPGLQ